MKKVYLCKGCIEQMQQQHGPSLGFTKPTLIEKVDKKECDMRTISGSTLFYETINWDNRQATPEEISKAEHLDKKFIIARR